MIRVVIVLCVLVHTVTQAEYENKKWKVLLRAQSSAQLAHGLQVLNKENNISQKCQFELSREQIPFSCYKLSKRNHSFLDKRCQSFKEKLRDVDFPQIKFVSKNCQRDLQEARQRLHYIKSAENPSAVYFNEVIDK